MIPERYNRENFIGAVKNPSKFRNEMSNLLLKVQQLPNKFILKMRYGKEIYPIEKDWDNLIILDACRYDIFREICNIDGELMRVVSTASYSEHFYKNNFHGRELYDTVLVTSNAFGHRMSRGVFHALIDTFDKKNQHVPNHVAKVDPDRVYEETIDAHSRFPNKRLIAHFMQPHEPYFGDRADELRSKLEETEGIQIFAWKDANEYESLPEEKSLRSLQRAAAEGYISSDELHDIYIENLEIVLERVESLLSELNGKTVITADHGELLGYSRNPLKTSHYGHPPNHYLPQLRVVPWLVVNSDNRREIIPDTPIETADVDEEVLTEQLEAMGYIE